MSQIPQLPALVWSSGDPGTQDESLVEDNGSYKALPRGY